MNLEVKISWAASDGRAGSLSVLIKDKSKFTIGTAGNADILLPRAQFPRLKIIELKCEVFPEGLNVVSYNEWAPPEVENLNANQTRIKMDRCDFLLEYTQS